LTLNFKLNFKFSGLKFLGGTPSQFGCALAGLGQSVARVRAFHRGGDGDKLSPSWARGGKSSPPPELGRLTHEQSIVN